MSRIWSSEVMEETCQNGNSEANESSTIFQAKMDAPRDIREWIDFGMFIYLIIVLGILNIMVIQRAIDNVLLAQLSSKLNQGHPRKRPRTSKRDAVPPDRKRPLQQPLSIIAEESQVQREASSAKLTLTEEPKAFVIPNNLIDLSGAYKLERKENFQEFLASQGVSWALRKAADKANPTNKITHDMENHTVTIGVEGIITSSTTYVVNGPPIETKIQSKSFQDTMKYLETGDGVIVTKVNEEDGYYITVKRQLSKCRQEMTITSTAVWPDKQVESIQYYSRIK